MLPPCRCSENSINGVLTLAMIHAAYSAHSVPVNVVDQKDNQRLQFPRYQGFVVVSIQYSDFKFQKVDSMCGPTYFLQYSIIMGEVSLIGGCFGKP